MNRSDSGEISTCPSADFMPPGKGSLQSWAKTGAVSNIKNKAILVVFTCVTEAFLENIKKRAQKSAPYFPHNYIGYDN